MFTEQVRHANAGLAGVDAFERNLKRLGLGNDGKDIRCVWKEMERERQRCFILNLILIQSKV